MRWVAAGAAAFVMCGFMVRDNSRGEGQIVSYVVSGIGFLGAGVIFKDSGSVRGLNTAATIWCSVAIGAISGLGNPLHALILTDRRGNARDDNQPECKKFVGEFHGFGVPGSF